MDAATVTPVIRLQLLGEEAELPYEELNGSISPYSEKSLRRIGVQIDISADRSTELRGELNAARDPEKAFLIDGSHWAVSSNSYSYTQGGGVHRYEVELEEVEVLQADRIEMLGISLVPVKYKEKVLNDGVLVISCLARLGGNENKVLEDAIRGVRPESEYFDVKRVGVSDATLRVRFGRCLWEQQDAERLHLLRLVADEDEPVGGGVFSRQHEPELIRAQEKIAALEEKLAFLIEHLLESGTLREEFKAAQEEKVAASWEQRCREFDEAVDVEEFF